MLYWILFLLIAFAVGLQVLARYEMSIQRPSEETRRTDTGRSRNRDA
jgi:hypothetical protein